MSNHLKAFLSAWLEWVESGAPESEVFERFAGLCANFRWHLQSLRSGIDVVLSEDESLKAIFKSEGLHEDYPFGGEDIYGDEAYEETMHLNPARIAWVRSKVEQKEPA